MPLSELTDVIRDLLNQAEMSAEEYVRIDEKEETGQQLNNDIILTLVSKDEVPDNGNEEDNEDTTNPKEKDITISQAKDSKTTLISYFEQVSAIFTCDDIKHNSEALENIWPLLIIIADISTKESRQTKVTYLFRKLT
ncbi:hypothetical protein ACJMK2_016394 [Sinanodonta woodiana]|uniref:Uncharacterized protein n=1 Tax=Sinanodonta woodiana TaxID=1069815 RepID=A0ABD3UWJ6_SINWO